MVAKSSRGWLPALALLCGACEPETRTLGGTVTGTVIGASLEPVPLVAVYVRPAGSTPGSSKGNALTGGNGRFRLEAPAGTWTVVATDFESHAGFVYEVGVRGGEAVDVGSIVLHPCARPGSTPEGGIYEECPVPGADGDGAYGAPEAAEQSLTFVPDYTDAVLRTEAPRIADVTSFGGRFQLSMQIPETYFGVGTYQVVAGGDLSGWLLDSENGVFFTFVSGRISIEALEPQEGGAFRARLSDAAFQWHDPASNSTHVGYTAVIEETSPAMTDDFSTLQGNGPGSAMQPAQDYLFARFDPTFTQLYRNVDGSLSVGTFQSFGNGDYLEMFFEIPAESASSGSHQAHNTYGEDPSAWNLELPGRAHWASGDGFFEYALADMDLVVSDPLDGPGDAFAFTLGDVVFEWQAGPSSPPFSTLTLTVTTSSTISAVADVAGEDSGGWGLDWLDMKIDLFVNLGG